MTWVDMISMTIAAAAAVECVAGRIAPMDLRHHRPAVIAVYALAATVCILAASLVWQGAGLLVLTLADDGSVEEVAVPEETDGPFGRLRAARLGPDGALYVTTTNGDDDQLLRITPRA